MTTAQKEITAHLYQTDRLPIPDASKYEIDIYGFIYRNEKRLSLRRQGQHWYAHIYDDKGRHWFFDSERLARTMFGEEEYTLRFKDIEENFNVRPVPEFPRYAVTTYGAVYCVDPPKRGRNAGQCYLLSESMSREASFATHGVFCGKSDFETGRMLNCDE